ncbi:MAG: hypothetical protein ACRD3W_00310, partial [Terriglobales bacterium]
MDYLFLPKHVQDRTFADAEEILGLRRISGGSQYRYAVKAPGWKIEYERGNPALAYLLDPTGKKRAIIHMRLDMANENCDMILIMDKPARLAHWQAIFKSDPAQTVPHGIDPRFFLSHILIGIDQATHAEVAAAISAGGHPAIGDAEDTIVSNLLEQGAVTAEAVALAKKIQSWLAQHG